MGGSSSKAASPPPPAPVVYGTVAKATQAPRTSSLHCTAQARVACRRCGLLFNSTAELRAHETAALQRPRCMKCGETFASSGQLAQHHAQHHEASPCRHCSRMLPSRRALDAHVAAEHGHPCYGCKARLRSAGERDLHHERVHGFYECDRCEKVFYFADHLAEHYTTHAARPTIRCGPCDREFASEKSLAQHNEAKHKRKAPSATCVVCHRSFRGARGLAAHIAAKHPPPDPPVQTEGWWELREEFEGRKSFGFFYCCNAECSSRWVSAHAQPQFRQACKACEEWSHALWMWVNEDSEEGRGLGASKAPHDVARCE
eukprot:CAMPEP_0114606236 /NCGR_PEP_ID=MMETSP0168-20121206/1459_1 /TAXON_ID=95228 ORGANISM="Vannella sp., Strain DIVA3 517/6/12" /NCGR_SAMPLE_ID=MMETSP0168 /ASSEMBLY_ACC=CAM_ASM_000044 /LENGTH=315 /DNA_ID=CAMNT_0001817097 /DNA_START=43 /DNA_END=987 /DNA_ORIENTATION=-